MDNTPNTKIHIYNNAFDLISLFAALDVALAHTVAHTLGGGDGAQFNFWFLIAPGVSVVFFFSISGFLIAASLDRDSRVSKFAYKRALRIYPGLWVAILIPLIMFNLTGFLKSSFSDLLYCPIKLLTGHSIHGFDTPLGGLGNGSLWTICVQIQFYVLIALVWKFIKRFKVQSWLILIFLAIILNCLHINIMQYDNIFTKIYSYSLLPYLYIFLIGVSMYLFRDRIILLLARYWKMILAVFLIWHYGSELLGIDKKIPGHYINFVTGVWASVVVIVIGYGIGRIRLKHDISYSLFLWHMPVVDVLSLIVGISNKNILFICCIVVSICISVVSCRLIEEPALKLKNALK